MVNVGAVTRKFKTFLLPPEHLAKRAVRLVRIVEPRLHKDHGNAERRLDPVHILRNCRLFLPDIDDDLRIRRKDRLLIQILHPIELSEYGKIGVLRPNIGERGILPFARDADELVRRGGKEHHLCESARRRDALNVLRQLHRTPRGICERIGVGALLPLCTASREDAGEDEQHGKKEIFFTRHIAHLVFPSLYHISESSWLRFFKFLLS